MKRSFLSMMLATLALPVVTACPGGDEDPAGGESRPFRDDWRTVIDQPFDTLAEDGETVNIGSIIIGNEGGDNFRNRGDIVVKYHDSNRIIVEMRKFTMVENQELADADFDKLSIWGTTASLPPPPFNLDAEDDCVDFTGEDWAARKPWQDGCQIAVFYDGQQQVDRSGADLRITLPRDFIYDLTIVTEDNDADSDYQNRGNVCVEGLPGSADISLSNGTAWVILDQNMPEMPECPPSLRTECEEANWDTAVCGCLAQGYSFSQVKITANDGQSADGIVDIPSGGDFWVGYTMRNDGQNDPGNEEPGALCEAVVDPSAGTIRLSDSTNLDQAPNSNQGSINFPGAPATEGAGYSIQMTSDTCAVVLATETPDGFVGAGLGPEQPSNERGNMAICSGCARSVGCDALVPGL